MYVRHPYVRAYASMCSSHYLLIWLYICQACARINSYAAFVLAHAFDCPVMDAFVLAFVFDAYAFALAFFNSNALDWNQMRPNANQMRIE